jgi:hypothetical protein
VELDAAITILGDAEGVTIRIEDRLSGGYIAMIKMSPEDFLSAAMGRLGCVHVKCETDVDRIGKGIIRKRFKFDVSGIDRFSDNGRKAVAERAAQLCPEGWTASSYFGSQDSFFSDGGVEFARTTLYRWVPVESEEYQDYVRKREAEEAEKQQAIKNRVKSRRKA